MHYTYLSMRSIKLLFSLQFQIKTSKAVTEIPVYKTVNKTQENKRTYNNALHILTCSKGYIYILNDGGRILFLYGGKLKTYSVNTISV